MENKDFILKLEATGAMDKEVQYSLSVKCGRDLVHKVVEFTQFELNRMMDIKKKGGEKK